MMTLEIIGNLGADAEVKKFNDDDYVVMSVADTYKDKSGDAKTTWVSVLKKGDGGNLLQYLTKGSKVFIRGRLVVSVYKDKKGNAQPSVNMYASEIYLCGEKEHESSSNSHSNYNKKSDDLPF